MHTQHSWQHPLFLNSVSRNSLIKNSETVVLTLVFTYCGSCNDCALTAVALLVGREDRAAGKKY